MSHTARPHTNRFRAKPAVRRLQDINVSTPPSAPRTQQASRPQTRKSAPHAPEQAHMPAVHSLPSPDYHNTLWSSHVINSVSMKSVLEREGQSRHPERLRLAANILTVLGGLAFGGMLLGLAESRGILRLTLAHPAVNALLSPNFLLIVGATCGALTISAAYVMARVAARSAVKQAHVIANALLRRALDAVEVAKTARIDQNPSLAIRQAELAVRSAEAAAEVVVGARAISSLPIRQLSRQEHRLFARDASYDSLLSARPSFLRGIAQFLDVGGTLRQNNERLVPAELTSTLALVSDWEVIGTDAEAAFARTLARFTDPER